MTTQTQEALTKERPNQNHSTTDAAASHQGSPSEREGIAHEAVRSGLCAAGIDHDQLDLIADRIVDALREADLLPRSFAEIIGPVDPKARVYISISIFPQWQGWQEDCPSRYAARSQAQAAQIVQAILAEHEGKHEVEDRPRPGDPSSPLSSMSIHIDLADIDPEDIIEYMDYTVFYDAADSDSDTKEDTPHGTTVT